MSTPSSRKLPSIPQKLSHKSLFINQNSIKTLFLCFYFNSLFLRFPPLPTLLRVPQVGHRCSRREILLFKKLAEIGAIRARRKNARLIENRDVLASEGLQKPLQIYLSIFCVSREKQSDVRYIRVVRNVEGKMKYEGC